MLSEYYRYARPEVQALVNPKARRILDVGCASGKMASELKEKYNAEVWGIEYVKEAAALADEKLDRVICGSVEAALEELPDGYFDSIIFADVLEHLADPYKVLKIMKEKLTAQGEIVASIPNVRHWSVVKGLLEGDWQYQDAGILDRTHLRFFTRKSIMALFMDAGFQIREMKATQLTGVQIPEDVFKAFKKTRLNISTLWEESRHYQYLVSAEKVAAASTGEQAEPERNTREEKVSIVMLTRNALEYTRQCIDSILRYTKYPYEIIFVDNGSSDGTLEYLEELLAEYKDWQLIKNETNQGFSVGNNQGARLARGKYLCILNNDVLVSSGWLGSLVRAIEIDERIGMVGPLTNRISGKQMLENIPYSNESGFHLFAQQVRGSNDNKITPRRRIAGFAMLIRKSLYEILEGFDESFGNGNFEDDDLCLRVCQEGYAIMVDESTFVHHYGSRTFKANQIDYSQALTENQKVFQEKWPDVNYSELLEIENPLNEAHEKLLSSATRSLLERDIEAALRDFQIILREDPLSADALFGMALCSKEEGERNAALYYLKILIHLYPDHAPGYNEIGIMFAEDGEWENAKFMFTLAIEKDPVFIDAQRNYGDMLIQLEDYENGVKVVHKILENHPDDVLTMIYLAQLFVEANRLGDAESLLEKVLTIESDNDLAQKLLTAIKTAGRKEQSDLDWIIPEKQAPASREPVLPREAGRSGNAEVDNLLRDGKALLEAGYPEKALEKYTEILRLQESNTEAQYGLGVAHQMCGAMDEAQQLYRSVIQTAPDYPEAYQQLGIILKDQGKFEEAIEQLQKAASLESDNLKIQLELADALIASERCDAGINVLLLLLREHPEEIAVLNRLGKLHQVSGRHEEAALYFKKVLSLDPENTFARDALQIDENQMEKR